MLLNTYKFNSSKHDIFKRCLAVFSGVYHKNTNNIHNILYTKHLNTYIMGSHGTNTYMNTIKFNIPLYRFSSKKVFRCLASRPATEPLNTAKHLMSSAIEKKVFSSISSTPIMKTLPVAICPVSSDAEKKVFSDLDSITGV